MITGTFLLAGTLAGRRMSACSLTPPLELIVASLHFAPGGTGAAAAEGAIAKAAMAASTPARLPPTGGN
jgi:hypothetical protein